MQWVIGGSDCQQVSETCSIDSTSPNNILVTQYITKPVTASQILITVDFEPGMCPPDGSEMPQCSSDFSLHIYNTPSEDTGGVPSFSNFDVVQSPVVNGAAISVTAPMEGFYLAFQDMSTCVNITRVRVIYMICPATINSLAQYSDASLGQTISGMCVGNSSAVGTLMGECSLDASFNFSSAGSCVCDAGYEAMDDQCDGESCTMHEHSVCVGAGSHCVSVFVVH